MSSATLDRPSAPTQVRSAPRPARPVAPTVPERSAVRLTRRGRLVVLALVSLVALALIVVGAASVSAATSSGAPATTSTVVVQPGQTLWEVAEQVAPDRDPREVIKRISDLNALSSSVVAPGQALSIPAF